MGIIPLFAIDFSEAQKSFNTSVAAARKHNFSCHNNFGCLCIYMQGFLTIATFVYMQGFLTIVTFVPQRQHAGRSTLGGGICRRVDGPVMQTPM